MAAERGESAPKEKPAKVEPKVEKEKLRGKIEFKSVEMRYKPELEPALRDVSFTVQPGERVAVVGRTGAGKSSLY